MENETNKIVSRAQAIDHARNVIQLFHTGNKWIVRHLNKDLDSWWSREWPDEKKAELDASVFRLKIALRKIGMDEAAIREEIIKFKKQRGKWFEHVPKKVSDPVEEPVPEPEQEPTPDSVPEPNPDLFTDPIQDERPV